MYCIAVGGVSGKTIDYSIKLESEENDMMAFMLNTIASNISISTENKVYRKECRGFSDGHCSIFLSKNDIQPFFKLYRRPDLSFFFEGC